MAFLKNFETAFTQNIGDTEYFSEMFANCRIFVFSNALEKAAGGVTDIISIAQMT